MSMHKIPLTPIEEAGLRAHGLDIGTPSQLSDAFRQGVRYASAQLPSQGGEAVEVFTTWHPDSRSYEEQIVSHDTKGSRKALGAMNAKLRAKVGRLERELATVKQSLTVEPVAYAAFAENGNIRVWCRSAIGMCELFDAHGNKAVPLYTHPADQVADDLTMVKVSRELLELLCEMVDLHDRRSAVLTVHMEHLRALLAKSELVKK
jgi:hypothetical protein